MEASIHAEDFGTSLFLLVSDHTNPQGWKITEWDGKTASSPPFPLRERQCPGSRTAPHSQIHTKPHQEEVAQRQGELIQEELLPYIDPPSKQPHKELPSNDSKILANEDREVKEGIVAPNMENTQIGWKAKLDKDARDNKLNPSQDDLNFNNRNSCIQYTGTQEEREKYQNLPHGWMPPKTKHETRGSPPREAELPRSQLSAKKSGTLLYKQHELMAANNSNKQKKINMGGDDPGKEESNTRETDNKIKEIAGPIQDLEVTKETIRKQDMHSEGLLNKNENNEVWSSIANLPPGWKTVKGKAKRLLGRIHGQTKSRL